MASYDTLTTESAIRAYFNGPYGYVLWARVYGRDDIQVFAASGVRTVEGRLQVNAGEYSRSANRFEGAYLNEEWVTPDFVFLKHWCDNCHYPPSMCCLDALTDDAYGEAEEELHRMPPDVVTIAV